MQGYSNPDRESDSYALPDIEVFYVFDNDDDMTDENGEPFQPGYYWWTCFPGCLPDSDPIGPFSSEEEAIADARKE